MSIIPKKKGSLYIRGSDGNQYVGYYEAGSLFTNAPGFVRYTGWRRAPATASVGMNTAGMDLEDASK